MFKKMVLRKLVLRYLERVEIKLKVKKRYYANEVIFYQHNYTMQELILMRENEKYFNNMIIWVNEIMSWIKGNM